MTNINKYFAGFILVLLILMILVNLMMTKITLKELNVFYFIVKYKTVQMAAESLHITQSAASQALLKLENRLNTTLFDRNGRQLIMNENGRLLLPLTISIVNSVQEVERLFSTFPIAIKIGASTTIGNYIMPSQLAQFRQRYPLSKLAMMVNNTDAIISAVANFEVDIGLIEGGCSNDNIIMQSWQDDELVIFKAYSTDNTTMTKEQLSLSQWLLREKGSGTREMVEQFLKTHLTQFNISMELGNSEAIKYAVAAELGISCLSRYVVDDLIGQNKISLINSSLPKLTRKFYIITHKNKQYTQGMKHFMDLLYHSPDKKEFIMTGDMNHQ